MKMLMLMMMLMSIILLVKHLLSMGFILLMQIILASLTCSCNLSSYFTSYVLFLIFIGVMMILFMYMSSIAWNEKFIFSMKLMLMNILMTITIWYININFNSQNMNMLINFYNEHCTYFMNKLHMLPSGNITLLMIIYYYLTYYCIKY